MFPCFNASLSGRDDTIKNVCYLWQPKMNIYYVAQETMQAGFLPRILAYAGAISVERTGAPKVLMSRRKRYQSKRYREYQNCVGRWLLHFRKGRLSLLPVRKGTAHIIKQHRPIVVPIVIDGFRRS
jgi:1-acyl-sn-glycerol-3-phosphate acyltransferase